MSENTLVRYHGGVASSEFGRVLTDRVNAYFEERGISKHANAQMVAKGIMWFSLWILTYAALISDWFSPLGVIAMYVVHGFAELFMTYNISHDANHGAYSSSKRVNRILSATFDLVGISSYVWRLLHNTSHHSFVNVQGKDTAIGHSKLWRFAPEQPWTPIQRYQHLYISLIYMLPTLDWVLTKDYYFFFFHKDYGNRRVQGHPKKALLFMLATKLFYYAHILVIPLLVLSVPWYIVVLGFLAMHAGIGFHIALIFQPNHITLESAYPLPSKDGYLERDFVSHVFATTCDYSRKYPFTTWMLGGLNLHVIHHMFPSICSVHYPALTEILRETAAELGYNYREKATVFEAYADHLKFMKRLGNPDARSTHGEVPGQPAPETT